MVVMVVMVVMVMVMVVVVVVVVVVLVVMMMMIQNPMLRMVLEDCESSYDELLSKCGISMLVIQRARTLAIKVYKSIHKRTPIYIQEMFNIKVTPI